MSTPHDFPLVLMSLSSAVHIPAPGRESSICLLSRFRPPTQALDRLHDPVSKLLFVPVFIFINWVIRLNLYSESTNSVCCIMSKINNSILLAFSISTLMLEREGMIVGSMSWNWIWPTSVKTYLIACSHTQIIKYVGFVTPLGVSSRSTMYPSVPVGYWGDRL